ncbi:MAG: hypothetical protein ACJA01_004042, partial [Saprospiraceae bacterium]
GVYLEIIMIPIGVIENNLIFGLDPNAEYRKASGEKRVQGLLSERVDD